MTPQDLLIQPQNSALLRNLKGGLEGGSNS